MSDDKKQGIGDFLFITFMATLLSVGVKGVVDIAVDTVANWLRKRHQMKIGRRKR